VIDVVADVAALEAGATRIGAVKPRVSMAGEGFALKSPTDAGGLGTFREGKGLSKKGQVLSDRHKP
jgi:hypothetical protein